MSKAPIETLVKRHGTLRSKQVRLGEQQVLLYTIGWLSLLTNMALSTLRLWERQKVLPPPIVKVGHQGRYYTAVELQEYRAVLLQLRAHGTSRQATQKQQLFWAAYRKRLAEVQQLLRLKQPLPKQYLGLVAVVSLGQQLTEVAQQHESTFE